MSTVLVTGDLVVDDYLAHVPSASVGRDDPPIGAIFDRGRGGGWHLAEVVRAACDDLEGLTIVGPSSPDRGDFRALDAHGRSFAIWSPHERTLGSRERVWRVEQSLRSRAGTMDPAAAQCFPHIRAPNILVLTEHNLGFRQSPEFWPVALREGDEIDTIILKLVAPLGRGRLWEELVARYADRLTVVVSASALRARQAAISEDLSWDRTIGDVEREFASGASVGDLARARRVAVYFRGAGAAIFTRTNGQRMTLERFVFHPDELAHIWHRRRPGLTFGATSILTAALVRHILSPDD